MYADDTNLLHFDLSIEDALAKMQVHVKLVTSYFNENSLNG